MDLVSKSKLADDLRASAQRRVEAAETDLIALLVTQCKQAAEKGLYQYSTYAPIPDNVERYLKDVYGFSLSRYTPPQNYSGVYGGIESERTTYIISW